MNTTILTTQNNISEVSGETVLAKVAWRILPLLFLAYVVAFLDRINIGFAQLQMSHDLGFSDAMYGFGAAVFYIAYILFEVPSNLLMVRFGARKTFTRIMLLWGLTSMSMMFVSTPAHFYGLRFLLGMFEAGFFPGILLYLSYWFPANRRAAVVGVFFAGVAVSGVVGGLLSGWIMHGMNGMGGLFGWQWMFIIEGLPAVLLAFLALVYLVDGPAHARWLSKPEQDWLVIACQAPAKPAAHPHAHELVQTLRNPYLLPFAFIYFSLACASLTLNFWMPLMIRDFGVQGVVQISLYTAIPNAIGAVGLLLIARHSDRTGERRIHFALCTMIGALALVALTLQWGNLVVTMAFLSVATILILAALPIFWAVPMHHLSTETRATGLALISSIGLISGIVSPWVIGHIRTATGSMNLGFYILGALLILSGLSMLWVDRHATREPEEIPL